MTPSMLTPRLLTPRLLIMAAFVAVTPALLHAQSCPMAPMPVVSLDYDSRYQADSTTKSELDPKADAEVNAALGPVDDFLRDMTELANDGYKPGADRAALADCVVQQIALWAGAGALTDLKSPTSNLTMGARFAGFGLVLLQVLPHTTRTADVAVIKGWLATLHHNQTEFWETGAPDKARKGNLRAWAALSAATAADILDDPVLRAWALFSVSYVLCSADPGGSLPQEMSRGKYALKYQLHAIAPLVVATLLLERAGMQAQTLCDGALARVIGFATADLDSGAATEAITGHVQTFFDGSDQIEAFHLAWLEAYLIFDKGPDRAQMEQLAARYRPLNYSKLGGEQALIWAAP